MGFKCNDPNCGMEFETLNELGSHARSTGHKGVRQNPNYRKQLAKVGEGSAETDKPKSKGTGMTEEQLEQLRDLEFESKKTEIELRKRKAEHEMRRYGSNDDGNGSNLHKFSLPDGTIVEATAREFRDLLEVYYLQNNRKSNNADGENETIRLLREEVKVLKERDEQRWRTEMEQRVNSALSKDPETEASKGYSAFLEKAKLYGYARESQHYSSPKDEVARDSIKTGLDELKTSLNSFRSERVEDRKFIRNLLNSHPGLLEKGFPVLRGTRSNAGNLPEGIPPGAQEESYTNEDIARLNAALDDDPNIQQENRDSSDT